MKPALRPRILSQLRDMLAEREEDVEALQARLRLSEGAGSGSSSGLVVALERRLEALEVERAARASEAERWRAEAETMRRENERLKAKVASPEKAEQAELWSREREALHKRLASAVEEASMLRSQLQSRQADVSRLERRVSELENLDDGGRGRGANHTFGGEGVDDTQHLLHTPSLPTAAPSPMFPLPSPGPGADHSYHPFCAAGPPPASSHWFPHGARAPPAMAFTPQSSARGMQPPSYCPAAWSGDVYADAVTRQLDQTRPLTTGTDGPLLRCGDGVRRSVSQPGAGGPCASFGLSPSAHGFRTALTPSPFNADTPSDARRPSPLRDCPARQNGSASGLWTPPPPNGRPEGRAKSVEPAQSEPLAAALGMQLQHLMAQPMQQSLADGGQPPMRSQSVPVHVRRMAGVPVPVSPQVPANLARWASIPPSAGTCVAPGTIGAPSVPGSFGGPSVPFQMHAEPGSFNLNGPSPAGDFRVPPSNR